MIFYFSGTGNTLFVAKSVANAQLTDLKSIAQLFDEGKSIFDCQIQKDGMLGIAFPVHAWAPPKIALDFVKRLNIVGEIPYLFSLAVCGGEEGYSTRIMEKALLDRGLKLDSAFTLIMPNNFLLGVDVDSKLVEEKKLFQSEEKLETINTILKERRKGFFDTHNGPWPGLKSYLINPLFKRFFMNTKNFYATELCTGCKICEKICPVHTISVNGKPAWKKQCTHCLACINSCPEKAIEYGKLTVNRLRYLHPERQKELWN